VLKLIRHTQIDQDCDKFLATHLRKSRENFSNLNGSSNLSIPDDIVHVRSFTGDYHCIENFF